jgi:metal-responsive CopG/Arc/MetJ family transcriptional regulator
LFLRPSSIDSPIHHGSKTFNIALDEKLLKEVDEAVKQDMISRSEYFRRLALADLNRRRWANLLDMSNKKRRKLGIS